MHASLPRNLALAVLAAAFAGCTTTIPIHSTEPGPVAIGGVKQLVLVKGEGRRSARETLAQAMQQQARAQGWFTVADRTEEPVFARVAGGRVVVEDPQNVLGSEGVVGVKIDVLEWDAQRTSRTVEKRTAKGQQVAREVMVQQGHVLLAVTIFDRAGRAVLAEREYEGRCETEDMTASRDALIDRAGAQAIARLLHDVTPVQVVKHVRLDEEDEGQAAILETAKSGNVAQAARDARAYVDSHPGNTTAAYNLAVLLDALGRHEEAMTFYDEALRGGSKDFYVTARADCARRIADRQALSATPQR